MHFEIPAQDTTRAQKFYKDMFGWEFQPFEGPTEYNMARISESAGAAVFPSEPGAIRVVFDVDDINAGAAKLRDAGGEADDPQPVPSMGWFVTGKDTEGNSIGLWQNDSSAPGPS
ncbi:MAG: VOC family protein [Actinobacteria bacterium]|nr:MAG: VOC family protein [Actinomycetota bacterium]